MRKIKINPGQINFKSRHLKNSLLAILIGAFIAWLVDTINYDPTQTPEPIKIEQEGNLEIIEGIAYPVDGDSIKINHTENIRLLEIDAPEFSQKCLDKNGHDYKCGEISAQFLKTLIAGKKITCKSPHRDMYNRHLSFCYLGETNINYEILKNGMAIIYDVNKASPEALKLEEQAKTTKIGIWQGAFLEPKEYRKKKKGKFSRQSSVDSRQSSFLV